MTIAMWFHFLVPTKCSPSLYSCPGSPGRNTWLEASSRPLVSLKYFCKLSSFCYLCWAEPYVYSSHCSQTGSGKPLHQQLIHKAVDCGFQVFCSYPMIKTHMIRDVWYQGFTQFTAHLLKEQFSVLYRQYFFLNGFIYFPHIGKK